MDKSYLSLLDSTINQIDAMLYEIDSFSHQPETPSEKRFDLVPISRRLKEAKKYAQESVYLSQKKLKHK